MVRKVTSFVVLFLICVSCVLCSFAYGGKPCIVDNADLLTEEQESYLSRRISEIVSRYSYDLVIYTDSNCYGNEGRYAADFYERNGYGIGTNSSGSVFFVSMNPANRCYYTAATGDCEYLYKKSRTMRQIDDAVFDYMSGGQYYQAFDSYLNYIDSLYASNASVSREASQVKDRLPILGVILLIGLGLGAIIAAIIQATYVRDMRLPANGRATNYAVASSFKLSNVRKTFLYNVITKVPIPQNNSSGGSGGFSSSGGTHFSGGGRHF